MVDTSLTRIDNGYLRSFQRAKAIAAHRVEFDLSREPAWVFRRL